MRKMFGLVCLLIAVSLYGCAKPTETTFDHPVYHPKPWEQRKVNLNGTQRWNIQGAISVRMQNKTQMGTFTWRQYGPRYTINIYGPLNLTGIGILGMPGRVTLYKPTGTYTARIPESLMQQQLGWYLPISNLFYWVRGLPAPGMPAKQSNDRYGHLASLQQQGWNIQFQAFQPQGKVDLPRKIVMSNQQLQVKLVLKNWNLN